MRRSAKSARHVLVVAAQAKKPTELPGLKAAAHGLHDVLTDPERGGCTEREESLLYELAPGVTRVRDAVVRAGKAAAADRAVLVLAFLGHGSGEDGQPYRYVVSGDPDDPALDNLDLPSLVGDILDLSGLAGLIVVVDTCHAAGARPDTNAVLNGRQGGTLQRQGLFACASHETAWDFSLTRALTEVLREGLPKAGPFLYPGQPLRSVLQHRITDQTIVHEGGAGGLVADEVLWLARNPRSRPADFGEYATRALDRAYRGAFPGRNRPDSLTEILDQVRAEPPVEELGRWSRQRQLKEMAEALKKSQQVLNLVTQEIGDTLTEENVQAAAVLAGFPGEMVWPVSSPRLRDAVEYAALERHGPSGEFVLLARFLAALAHVHGRTALPPAWGEWLHGCGVRETANTWVNRLGACDPGQQARLVVTLFDDGGEQVSRIEAWLLYGRAVLDRSEPQEIHARGPLSNALQEILRWAKGRVLRIGWILREVDLAVPTLPLLDQAPEHQTVGTRGGRLGIEHTVTVRWAGLLEPPCGVDLSDLLHAGLSLLDSHTGASPCDLQWLKQDVLESPDTLREELAWVSAGKAAWGISERPASRWEEMAEALLVHSPALVWPRGIEDHDPQAFRSAVKEHWTNLPARLAEAYQHGPTRGCGPLDRRAHTGVAWHDKSWQEFCTDQAARIVAAPQDETIDTREYL
ncbi:hypothetical protein OK006_8408 [Actinobacteria bacterium OK006]|nr:hypothetical protein OK006_8408 [Actinobacteria bacterium OK006]